MIRRSLFAIAASLMTLGAFSGTVAFMTVGHGGAVAVA
jgi:hypothetical protein